MGIFFLFLRPSMFICVYVYIFSVYLSNDNTMNLTTCFRRANYVWYSQEIKIHANSNETNCIPANFNTQNHTWRAAGKKTRTHNEFWITHLLQIACHRFIWLCMQSMRIAYAKKKTATVAHTQIFNLTHELNWIQFNSIQFSRHMHTLVWAQNIHKFWLLFITTPLPFHIKTNISLD